MRTSVRHWKQLSVPIGDLDVDVDDNTRRVAELFEQLPSTVLHLGYGKGESVIVAAGIAPERVRPLVDDLAEYRNDEILGIESTERGNRAVRRRQELVMVVREVVERHPKPAVSCGGPKRLFGRARSFHDSLDAPAEPTAP
jgi:hypothetical protein